MKYNLTVECDDADELAALIAKLNGKGKAVKAEEPADEPEDKPAKKVKKEEPADDEPAEKPAKSGKAKTVEQRREEIRGMLRELAEKVDRKTAVKLLSKHAATVDEVEEDSLAELKEQLTEAIENA